MAVLVIDDEAESRTILMELLTAEGIEVRVADGGELALASLQVTKPELILLDIRMPGNDGLEVCRRLKHEKDTRDIPVIFLSASAELREKVEGFRTGAVDFVTKPFQREELLARVRTHLELSRLRLHLEKRVAERTDELCESEQRFQVLADAAPVLIWASDSDKQCTFFNKGWLEFTGRSLDQELGHGWAESVHPDDASRILATYSSAFDARRNFQMEYRLRRADGEFRWVLDSGVPRLGPNNVFAGYIGSCIDITDLKLAQQADFERQKLESIGLLAAGIAHDFNNLLSGIIAEADLAISETVGDMCPAEELEKIRSQAFRASEIVRQLMVYAGRDEVDFGRVDVSSVVEDTVDLIRISISKHVVLKTDLCRSLPPIAGHAAQIRQLLMNLIINSSEAIGERVGVITVRTSPATADDGLAIDKRLEATAVDRVALEVSDDGSGMTEEQRCRIFDPFFTTKLAGRGLGLAVVHGVVRAHGGEIKVRSVSGRGTTFRILLPCASQTAQQEEPDMVSYLGHDDFLNGTVLFVEDEEHLRTGVSKLLRKQGFSVMEANNGASAIDLLRDETHDVAILLLDMNIPGALSSQVVEEALRSRPSIKVILTSAYDAPIAGPLHLSQIAGFIRKPIDLSNLVQMLRKSLSSSEPSRVRSLGV